VLRSRRGGRRDHRACSGRWVHLGVGRWLTSTAGQRRWLVPRRPVTGVRARPVRRRLRALALRSAATVGAIATRVSCASAGARHELAVRRPGSLAGGVFGLALAFALESGRGFPVAKRAGGDAELSGDRLLCHSLAEQLRRPLLFSGSLLAAAALVGALLLRPRPRRLAAPARRDAGCRRFMDR
jgi:hypothetical protein